MLRLRLILWYSLLVVLTICAIGLFQYYKIRQSLFEALDASLIGDARTTLTLISTLPATANPREMVLHGEVHASSSLRDLIDRAITEVPDTLKGPALADRVVSEIIDQVFTELSFEDSAGKSVDPLDAIVERTVSSRRNNLVEIYAVTSDSQGYRHDVEFRSRYHDAIGPRRPDAHGKRYDLFLSHDRHQERTCSRGTSA